MITLKNGAQFECPYAVWRDGVAFIRIQNASIVDVARAFSNRNAISKITGDTISLDGYTRLAPLMPEGASIRIRLEKE